MPPIKCWVSARLCPNDICVNSFRLFVSSDSCILYVIVYIVHCDVESVVMDVLLRCRYIDTNRRRHEHKSCPSTAEAPICQNADRKAEIGDISFNTNINVKYRDNKSSNLLVASETI